MLFLIDSEDFKAVKESIEAMNLYNELVHFSEGAVFWGKIDEKEFLKTAYHKKLMKQDYYKTITKHTQPVSYTHLTLPTIA